MEKSLICNPKIKVRKSSIHGYGVFAKEDIKKGEILEECHFISLPTQFYFTIKTWPIYRYIFYYPKDPPTEEFALPFGNGCIYNSSSTPNADWNTDVVRRLFIFLAIKDIKKGEEICTNYEASIEWCKQYNLI